MQSKEEYEIYIKTLLDIGIEPQSIVDNYNMTMDEVDRIKNDKSIL